MIEKQKKHKILVKRSFLSVAEDEVILPNNKETKRVYVMHPGASAILAMTKENEIILTKQYRYPIKAVSLEIPAGKNDVEGESFLEVAKRELEEETGYTSDNFERLCSYYPCVGYSDEILHIFIARDCYLLEEKLNQDSDEFVIPILKSKEEVKQMLKEKEFLDGKTIIALQYLFNTF